jgi:hypothetical protein
MVRSWMDGSIHVCFLKLLIVGEYHKYAIVMLVKRSNEIAMSIFAISQVLLRNETTIVDVIPANIYGMIGVRVIRRLL